MNCRLVHWLVLLFAHVGVGGRRETARTQDFAKCCTTLPLW